MLQGNLIIEQFGYAVSEQDFEMLDVATGLPNGQRDKRKVLKIQVLDSQNHPSLLLEIRMTEDDFAAFVQGLTTPQVAVATPSDLAALGLRNGAGQ